MRHPLDGLIQPAVPAQEAPAAVTLTRRSALEKMVFAAAGFVALPAAGGAQQPGLPTTQAVGEEGAGPVVTTQAVGEEGGVVTRALNETGMATVTTEPFGEEAG